MEICSAEFSWGAKAMGDGPKNALVHIDGKVATTALEEASKGIGGIFRPWQIKRIAKAQAAADLIKAESDIKISELQLRALHRVLEEEALHQANMEAIVELAMPQLTDGANREQVDDDWMSNFFDKCRGTSNEEMQTRWSRILAGEVNEPGLFSRRTVNFMADLDRTDCEMFTKLCCFSLHFEDAEPPEPSFVPFVGDLQQPIYRDNGINFDSLVHLDNIGLIKFGEPGGHFALENATGCFRVHYFDTTLNIEMRQGRETGLNIGRVMFTQVGGELARIVGGTKRPGFLDYVRARWAPLLEAAP
jgi:hypothetical protein